MVNEELRGNWRDIFKVVKFSFDPKKIFIQMVGFVIAICLLLIFIQLGCFVSSIKCGMVSDFFLESSKIACKSCKDGIGEFLAYFNIHRINIYGIASLIIGFILFLTVFLTTNGIVCKIAVENFLKDELIEINEAVRYGINNFKVFILSPLVLVIIIALAFISLYVCGLIGRIPYLGEIVVSFSIIPIFLGGLLILFLLLVLSFGLSLLPSIIAVEDDDTLGAICDLFFVIITNFWKLIGYRIIFKFVLLILSIAVVIIGTTALYLGGIAVMAGLGEVKFFALINAFVIPTAPLLKITNIIACIFIAFIGLYIICIPLVYSNLANTIIYCNLEEKLKLAKEAEEEDKVAEEEKKEKEKEELSTESLDSEQQTN